MGCGCAQSEDDEYGDPSAAHPGPDFNRTTARVAIDGPKKIHRRPFRFRLDERNATVPAGSPPSRNGNAIGAGSQEIRVASVGEGKWLEQGGTSSPRLRLS